MRLSEMKVGRTYVLLPFTSELEDTYRRRGPGLDEYMVDFASTSPKVKVTCVNERVAEVEGNDWFWMAESFVGVQEEVKLSIN